MSFLENEREWNVQWMRILSILIFCGSLIVSSAVDVPKTDPFTKQNFLCRTWRVLEGLPVNHVECLHQSSDGYLWIGTPSGLVRFTGKEFEHFGDLPLQDGRATVIKVLCEDREGHLWIATKGGVFRKKNSVFTLYNEKNGLGGTETSCVAPSRTGGVWIGGESGLSYIDNSGVKSFAPVDLKDPFIIQVLEDERGKVWVGSRDGLYLFSPATEDFTLIWRNNHAPEADESRQVQSLALDRYGNVWFGLHHQVIRYDGRSFQVFPVLGQGLNSVVTTIFADRYGRMWFVVDDALQVLSGQEIVKYEDPYHLNDGFVRCLMEDREQNFWVGTRHNGLSRLKSSPIRVFTQRDGLCCDSVRSICQGPDDRVWLATDRGVSWYLDNRFETL